MGEEEEEVVQAPATDCLSFFSDCVFTFKERKTFGEAPDSMDLFFFLLSSLWCQPFVSFLFFIVLVMSTC